VSANVTVIIRCDHYGCTSSLVPAYDGESITGARQIARHEGWIVADSPEGRHRGGIDLCPAHTTPTLVQHQER
jgi:hypothetical protein